VPAVAANIRAMLCRQPVLGSLVASFSTPILAFQGLRNEKKVNQSTVSGISKAGIRFA